MNAIKQTPEGVIANEPSIQAIMSLIGNAAAAGHAEEDDPQKSAFAKAADDLKRAYARLFADPAGLKILEDLIDQTLRRGHSHPNPDAGIEQEALYAKQRTGQNGMVLYILRMIDAGQKLPAPGAKKPRKKAR